LKILKQYNIDLKNKRFIPNHSIEKVFSLLGSDSNFIYSRSAYSGKRINKTKTSVYKYPCVYSIKKSNDVSIHWSSENNLGHFGIVKYIVSNGAGFFKDVKGEYGLTEWAYAVPCKVNEMDIVEQAFNSKDLNTIFDAIALTAKKYNNKVLKVFKKDFWKDFI
jgi:hypothetical protein